MSLFLAQAAAPQPVPLSLLIWIYLLAAVGAVSFFLCLWLIWRMRVLGKALQALSENRGQPVSIPGGLGFFPRFSTRTLLILFTLAAVMLGMFGSELMRAKTQERILTSFGAWGDFEQYDNTHYRLGLFGDSYVAGLICHWVHPHFGCRLTHLALRSDYWNEVSSRQPRGFDISRIEKLRDLEALQINFSHLKENEIDAIASLPRLRRLSLRSCRLPQGAVKTLEQLEQLEGLELRDCGLWDDDLEGLERLTQLTYLSLAENPLTDAGMARIASLQNLRVLDLADTDLSDAGLRPLTTLGQVTDLILGDTGLTLEGTSLLKRFSRLRYVNLYHCVTILKVPDVAEMVDGSEQLEIDVGKPEHDLDVWMFNDNRPAGPNTLFGAGGGFGGGGQF